MSETQLSAWQAQFFSERVCTRASGPHAVYFREQVFGALDVLSEALPDLQVALGEQNFRFFVANDGAAIGACGERARL